MVKQKKQKRSSRAAIVIILCVIATIAAWLLFRMISNSITIDRQKNTLNKSLAAWNTVYNKTSDLISYKKEYAQRPQNSCWGVGVKYSTDYTCGNNFTMKITGITEVQYKEVDQGFVKALRNSGEFVDISVTAPSYWELTKGFSGTTDSIYKGTDMECYTQSKYNPDNKIATLEGGCHLTSSSQLFPLDD